MLTPPPPSHLGMHADMSRNSRSRIFPNVPEQQENFFWVSRSEERENFLVNLVSILNSGNTINLFFLLLSLNEEVNPVNVSMLKRYNVQLLIYIRLNFIFILQKYSICENTKTF